MGTFMAWDARWSMRMKVIVTCPPALNRGALPANRQ